MKDVTPIKDGDNTIHARETLARRSMNDPHAERGTNDPLLARTTNDPDTPKATDDPPLATNVDSDAPALRALGIDRRGRERVRGLLNVLTESTFFYREDDPDLFFFLRRNQAAVREFFETYFGWRLHVDRRSARLLKERQYNQALRPSQRALFDLRRRDECLLFALLLEFHEEEGQRQGVTPGDDRQFRFFLSDFVAFAIRRFREELGDATPGEARIFEATRPLFEQLERHRFVRLVDKRQAESGEDLPTGMAEHLLYEFLPGIRSYDPSLAARRIVVQAYRSVAGQPDTTAPPYESAAEDPDATAPAYERAAEDPDTASPADEEVAT